MTICCDEDIEKLSWELALSEIEEQEERKKNWTIYLSEMKQLDDESDCEFKKRLGDIESLVNESCRWIKMIKEKFSI